MSALQQVEIPERDRRRQMFNQLWGLVAALFVLFGLFFRQETILVAPLLFLAVYITARFWNRNLFRGVTHRRILTPRRAFAGETIELTVELENRKLLPLSWLTLTDHLPEGLSLLDERFSARSATGTATLYDVFALRWRERLRKRYRIHCHSRGFYRLGPAHFVSGDIFGLSQVEARNLRVDWLIVYPTVQPLAAIGLPATDPFGDFKYDQRLFEDPLRTVGVRDYQPGDGFRRVHWKASARRQQLQSRVYEPAASHKVMLFLNTATFEQPWRGTIREVQEHLISVTASLANYAIEHRYAVGVAINSSVPNSTQHIRIAPGRSPQQLTRILEALAAVLPLPTMTIERLLAKESPRLPRGATLALIAWRVTPSLAATLLHLSRAGRKVVVITLDPSLPEPLLYQRVIAYHLSADGLALAPLACEGAEFGGAA